MLAFLVHCNLRQYHRIVLRLYVFLPPMSSQKRNPDDGDGPAGGDNPDNKRRKYSFERYRTVLSLRSTFVFFFLKSFCFTFIWDCSCMVVHMEVS